jgi:hypothetical protein
MYKVLYILLFTFLDHKLDPIIARIPRACPLTPNDLQRRRAVSPLKIKIPSKNIRETQQIHQLFIQFINYVW